MAAWGLWRRVLQPLRGVPREDAHVAALQQQIATMQRELATRDSDAASRLRAGEVTQHAAAAQAAQHSKAQFLAVIGDRLRQPLHAMHLFIGALQREVAPAQLPTVERLHEIAQAMGGVLEELLELARLDAKVVEATSTACAVHDLFAEQRARFEPLAQAHGITLLWHDGDLRVHSDAALLARVLHHLIGNAIEHAPRGRVLVAARRSEGGGVRLEVRDSGVGIARIHQAQIFEEFTQLNSGGRREKRLGLGLPICARIAELLGTRIGMRSELGRGSVFWIEVPRAQAVSRDHPATSHVAAA